MQRILYTKAPGNNLFVLIQQHSRNACVVFARLPDDEAASINLMVLIQ